MIGAHSGGTEAARRSIFDDDSPKTTVKEAWEKWKAFLRGVGLSTEYHPRCTLMDWCSSLSQSICHPLQISLSPPPLVPPSEHRFQDTPPHPSLLSPSPVWPLVNRVYHQAGYGKLLLGENELFLLIVMIVDWEKTVYTERRRWKKLCKHPIGKERRRKTPVGVVEVGETHWLTRAPA